MPTTVNPNYELISFDVASLHTNIPHDLGISIITFWLKNKRSIAQHRFSKGFILETVKIIHERDVFYFDGKFYRQKRGSAMGTKMAPTYATLVLGYPEHILYEQLLNSYGQEFASYVQQKWKRFLDDCFIIWNTDIPVEIFHTELNSLNVHIRFTVNRSKIQMPFLYVLIRISTNNNIIIDIFTKDTDTHMYLNFRSTHPKHIKINILFNLASRIITITNTEGLRDTRLRERRLYLLNQRYPEEIVEHGMQKALEKGPIHTELREQLHVTSNQNNIIPFVTTHNPRDYNIFHFMKQIEFNLNSNERMKIVLQRKKIINSKRQPTNLKRFF